MADREKFLKDFEHYRNNPASLIPVRERQRLLTRLKTVIVRERTRICAALYDDLGKSEYEALTSEVIPLLDSIKYLVSHLPKLSKVRRAGVSMLNMPGHGRIMPEPYGQVLIFSTWNYPLLLALDPLAGAVAAGNRTVLKLSHQAPATAQIIGELLEECFPAEIVTVAPGDMTLTELASMKFDYIFFTGGVRAGREVMKLAAENLTPVTLELGGKSPCIVDENADLKVAARRIVWGKFLNAGQTCVAPDYLLVHRKVKSKLCGLMQKYVQEFFGNDPAESRDYPRIVNDSHFQRLEPLLSCGRLITGGEKERRKLYIAPTIIDNVTLDDPVMAEEIFGPILPVIEVASMKEAVAIVNGRPKPLALYFFGGRRNRDLVLKSTSSGGVCVNDTVMHLINSSMPFGGVGASGMGAYHGAYSFKTFSHEKPVLYKDTWIDPPARYAPFTAWKVWIAKFLAR